MPHPKTLLSGGRWCALLLLATTPLAARFAPARAADPPPAAGRDSLNIDSTYAIASCAPNDGPAVTLYFGGTVSGSGHSQEIDPPFVQLSIWQGWTTLAGHSFVVDHVSGSGAASFCPNARTCDRLDGAHVVFDEAPPDHLSGTVDFSYRGRKTTKTFRARRVDIQMMCG